MLLVMPRPTRRKAGSPFYFRARVPADVRAAVGKDQVSFSLRTTDPAQAVRLHAEHLARHTAHWQALREGPRYLTTQTIFGLCEEWVEAMREEPGPPEVWSAIAEMLERTQGTGRRGGGP